MHRSGLCAAAAGLLLASAATSWSARAADSTTQSAQIAHYIDREFVPTLRAYDQALTISSAMCPPALDFRGGKVGYCTILVNSVPVRVGILYDAATRKFTVARSTFYEFDRLEKLEKSALLSDFGIAADVRCPGPRYQFLPVGTIFTCSVSGSPRLTTIKLRVEDNGTIFTYNPPGTTSPAWLTDALKTHAEGKPTILDGAVVARWSQNSMTATAVGAGISATGLSVTCPEKLDLTGTNHAICTVTLNGLTMRREVFIDPVKGVDTLPLDALIDRDNVQRLAQDDLNERLRQAGLPPDAVVHCASGPIVITPPGVFYCDATAGGKSYKLEVSVEDPKGTVHWRGIPQDGAPPSPAVSSSPSSGPSQPPTPTAFP